MKRDMELIRRILVAIEDHPESMGRVPLAFDGYTHQVVSYQVKLLHDQGLIEAVDLSSRGDLSWCATRLTWDGHDFIEAIRDDERWSKVKNWVSDAGKILTIETLKQAVTQLFL